MELKDIPLEFTIENDKFIFIYDPEISNFVIFQTTNDCVTAVADSSSGGGSGWFGECRQGGRHHLCDVSDRGVSPQPQQQTSSSSSSKLLHHDSSSSSSNYHRCNRKVCK